MKQIPVIEEFEEYKYPGYTENLNQQVIYCFENGFGASVILGPNTYGLEMMLKTPQEFDKDFVKEQLLLIDEDLVYDVVGHLDIKRMQKLLEEIKNISPFKIKKR